MKPAGAPQGAPPFHPTHRADPEGSALFRIIRRSTGGPPRVGARPNDARPEWSCSQPLAGDFERSLPYPWTTPGAATAPGRSTPFEGYGRGIRTIPARGLPLAWQGSGRGFGRGLPGWLAFVRDPLPLPYRSGTPLISKPPARGFQSTWHISFEGCRKCRLRWRWSWPLGFERLASKGVGVCQDPCHPLSNPLPPPFKTPATPLASNPLPARRKIPPGDPAQCHPPAPNPPPHLTNCMPGVARKWATHSASGFFGPDVQR